MAQLFTPEQAQRLKDSGQLTPELADIGMAEDPQAVYQSRKSSLSSQPMVFDPVLGVQRMQGEKEFDTAVENEAVRPFEQINRLKQDDEVQTQDVARKAQDNFSKLQSVGVVPASTSTDRAPITQTDLEIPATDKPTDYKTMINSNPVVSTSLDAMDRAAKSLELQKQSALDYGKQQANALEGFRKQQEQIDMENAQRRSEAESAVMQRLNDLDRATSEYAASKIDSPDEVWAKKSTGQKILAGIGMLLGAFGTRNGVNPAVKVLEDSINADIEVQKANLAKKGNAIAGKKSLYDMARQRSSDINEQVNAAKLVAYNTVQLQLQQMAAKYQGTDLAAKAEGGLAEIQLKKAALLGDIQSKYLMQANMQQGSGMNPEMLPEDQRERYVPGYGGLALNKGDASKFRTEILPASMSTIDSVNKLLGLADNGSKLSLAQKAEQEFLARSLIGSMRLDLFGPGQLTEGEQKVADKLIGRPLDVFALTPVEKEKLVSIRKKAKDNLDIKAKAIGLTPQGFQPKQLTKD